jgi:hypothetical protein
MAGKQTITFDNPLVIPNPRLGFANLLGPAAKDLVEADLQSIGPLFQDRVSYDPGKIDPCHVLFLYCGLETTTQIKGLQLRLRDLLRQLGCRIVVIASEVPTETLLARDFGQALSADNTWPTNIVITGNRNGAHFGKFFHELFAQMNRGVTMPMAWVQLAPQGPTQPPDIPGTICLMEVGHITFAAPAGRAKPASPAAPTGGERSWLGRLFGR